MFVCYLDDSGSDLQNPITTLAGYVARERGMVPLRGECRAGIR